MKKVAQEVVATPDTAVRVLKIGRCPSLSEKSELVYNVGIDAASNITFRVVANSGGSGRFNSIWVSLVDIVELLDQRSADKPITSQVLHSIFRGKSSNSPGFLFAVLKAEGLFTAAAEKDSGYRLGDWEAFKQATSALIESGVDLAATPESRTESPKKKRPAKGAA